MQDVLNAEERIKLLKEKLSHETPLPCEVKNFGGLTAVVYKETPEMEELKGYFRMGSLLADEIKDAVFSLRGIISIDEIRKHIFSPPDYQFVE